MSIKLEATITLNEVDLTQLEWQKTMLRELISASKAKGTVSSIQCSGLIALLDTLDAATVKVTATKVETDTSGEYDGIDPLC